MLGALRSLLDPGDWLAVKPRLDPAAPALRLDFAPSRDEVKFRLWVGGIVLALAAAVCCWLWDEGFLVILIFSGIALLGLFNLVYAILQIGFTLTLAITERSVAFDSQTRFGRKFWQEPLANYRGVMLRDSETAGGGIGNTDEDKWFHIVELAHPDPAKTVALHVTEGGPPPREVQQAFARRFRLPEVEPEGTADLRRPAADPGPAPPGVLSEQHDGITRISFEPARAGRSLAWIFWLLLPLGAFALVYQIDPAFAWIAGGVAALFVLMMVGLGALASRKEDAGEFAVCVGGQRVWMDRPGSGGEAVERLMRSSVRRMSGEPLSGFPQPGRGIALSAIDLIRVDDYSPFRSRGSGRHARLLIHGASGRMEYLGARSDRAKLEWVRDYLCFRLTNGAR